LLGRIDPNFGLSFVYLDSACSYDVLSSMPESIGDLFAGDAGGIQPMNV